MTFDWYKIFNLDDFLATGLVSRHYSVALESRGIQEILVTYGNEISIVFKDVIMPIEFEDDNPFTRIADAATYAVYKDTNQDVYLGIEVST